MARYSLALVYWLTGFAFVSAQAVPRADCFAVERLLTAERVEAEQLLWKMLDSEALYTVVGLIKPLSDGFWQTSFPAGTESLEVTKNRRLLATFACGDDLTAGVHVFANPFQGRRSATAFIAHRPLIRGVVLKYADLFTPLGVTILSEPGEILAKIDRADSATRWRAFGLLFGYPEAAVDFFVMAGMKQKSTGQFVERDFRHIPTFGSPQGRFVYAVPKGEPISRADQLLSERAKLVLTEYSRRREWYSRNGGAGPAALLRDWLDNGCGYCSTVAARVAIPPGFFLCR